LHGQVRLWNGYAAMHANTVPTNGAEPSTRDSCGERGQGARWIGPGLVTTPTRPAHLFHVPRGWVITFAE
jgi:hypothetical protein